MMEIDELKLAWQSLNQRAAGIEAVNLDILKERKLTGTRAALNRFMVAPAVDVVLGLLAALLTGSFLAGHWHELRYLIPGLVLHVFVLATTISGIRQLVVVSTVDYGAPVVAIQRTLGEAKTLRIRTTQWIVLLSPLLWTPLAIVAAKGLFDIDTYTLGLPLLLWNLGFGVFAIALMVWIARRHAGISSRSPAIRRLLDDIGGRNLTRAIAFLDDIRGFEKP